MGSSVEPGCMMTDNIELLWILLEGSLCCKKVQLKVSFFNGWEVFAFDYWFVITEFHLY